MNIKRPQIFFNSANDQGENKQEQTESGSADIIVQKGAASSVKQMDEETLKEFKEKLRAELKQQKEELKQYRKNQKKLQLNNLAANRNRTRQQSSTSVITCSEIGLPSDVLLAR